jgi:hypothetical protein
MDVIDVTERLMAEFEDRLGLQVITAVVNACRRDLQGTPSGPMPELLERLARQRLLDVVGALPGPQARPSQERVVR